MKIFVYSPDTSTVVPFQVALRREGLDADAQLRQLERLVFQDRRSQGVNWTSPSMRLLWDDYAGGNSAVACDFPIPHGFGSLVLSARARSLLSAFLDPYGELLPLDCDGADFWILNVTHIVDAIDAERAEWLPVPGEQPLLWREAFMAERIADAALFRLPPSFRKSGTYFTQRFLDEVARHGLTGFHGREIWDSEEGLVT